MRATSWFRFLGQAIYSFRRAASGNLGLKDNDITPTPARPHRNAKRSPPKSTTPYISAFTDLRKGPAVLEVPPAGPDGSVYGQVADAWQLTIADIGPSGLDKGDGGKLLFTPPGYQELIPAGYLHVPSPNFRIALAFRSVPAPGKTVADAYRYAQTLRLYYLSDASHPPEQRFVDPINDRYPKIDRTVAGSDPVEWPKEVAAPQGAPQRAGGDDRRRGVWGLGGVRRPDPHPNLCATGAEDLRYNRFHTTALCSPSRAALLTGRNHHVGIIMEFSTPFPGYHSIVSRSVGTLGEVLTGNGYGTAWFGKNYKPNRRNIAKDHPDKLEESRQLFLSEAEKNKMFPLDDRCLERLSPENRPSTTREAPSSPTSTGSPASPRAWHPAERAQDDRSRA